MIDDHIHCFNCHQIITRYDADGKEKEVGTVGVLQPAQTPEGVAFAIRQVPICKSCGKSIDEEREKQKVASKLTIPGRNSGGLRSM